MGNTGLLGAFITTIIASIAWQLVASAFPMAFMNSPITYILLRWCLFLESTGICSGAWVIAYIHKDLAGFQKDEVYVGTAEEREAGLVKGSAYTSDVGHLTGGAFPATKNLPLAWEDEYAGQRSASLKKIKEIREKLASATSEIEIATLNTQLKQEFNGLAAINANQRNSDGE